MSDLFSLGDSGQAVQDEAPASAPTTPPSHPPEQDTESQSISSPPIEDITPDSRPSSRSESPGSWSGSGSLSSHSQSRSPRWVAPPPPPPRPWTGSSSRSISPDNGNLPPLPPSEIWSRPSSRSLSSDIGGIPSPPPPGNHSWSRSPSPSSYTIPPPPPPITPPPPHPLNWRPPASASPNSSPSPRAELTLEERRQMIEDSTARIMAFLLSNNLANHSSDYAYSLSLFPFFRNINPGPEYSYPSNLPSCLIFVDRIGWLPSEEVSRYLMMGYRVWDNNGRRLHFSGTPIGFDGLKSPIRYPAKEICTQDPRQVPDLHWQIRIGDLSRPPDSEGVLNTMPWDIRLAVPEFSQEGTNLQFVQRAWIRNRFENAAPCYFRGDSFAYEEFGGWKVYVSPLKEIRFDDQAEWIDGPYARIGVDMQCLTTVYPSTHVTLKGRSDVQKLCELCGTLDFTDLFEWGLADVGVDFGTTDELMARIECDFCCLLRTLCEDGLDHLRRNDKKADEDDNGFNLTESIQALLIRDPGHCLSTKPCLVLKQSYHREYLGPIVSLRTVRGEIRGEFSLEDRRFVDFDLLKKMINTCASTHEECKREKMEEREMILIDVEKMCLVQVKSVQYITLSYVWGNKPIFKTTKENFQSLQIPGALDSVSRLTRDVASVVKGLGVKYLWIDALCIIQDDEEHKKVQISRMADIYGNSCLTIVALTGSDSDSPLPGISTPRPQAISVVHGMPFSFHLSGLTQAAHDQRYETRGWTFQERLISRRCLYFCDRQVYLECRKSCTSDHEQQFPEQDRGRYSVPLNPLHALHSKDQNKNGGRGGKFSLSAMETFISVVCQYTARTLSFPSDIENAFLGIQSFMGRKLGWRFIAGLPVGLFDWALLWVPKGQLKRRSWIDGEGKEVRPPSWSWMGWEGQVSFACYTYLHRVFFLQIRPRIESFIVRVGEERIETYREPSEVWHSDVEVLKDIHSSAPVENEDSRVGRDISFTQSPMLEFNAEFISAFQSNLYSRHRSHRHHHHQQHHKPQPTLPQQSTLFTHSIEWLTTGDSYGMLRHGLRYNYNASVQEVAETCDAERLALIAIAGADLQLTVRGGQFGEDKLFEEEGRVVLMLVVRVGGDGGGEGEGGEEVYERLAIGYLGLDTWEGMRPERKVFKLG